MIETLQLIAAILVVFTPGLALIVTLGVRDRLWWAALAAPVTFGLVLVTSLITGVTGVRFSAWTVFAVTVLAVAIAFAVRLLVLKPRDAPLDPADPAETPLRPAKGVGLFLLFSGIALAFSTWRTAMGSWATPSQEHDPITHSVLTAYIHFTGRAAPWQLAPSDVISGQPVSFYPPGFPQLSAVITDVTGGHAIVGMNLATVVLLAIVWPLSAGALAAAVTRLAGHRQGWTHLAAGVAALIAAVIYKPTISLAHDGGVIPQAIASAFVPGMLAAMLTIQRRHWAGSVLVALALAGTVSAHSSAVLPIAITGLAAVVGLLFTAAGRARFVDAFLPLLVAGGLAILVLMSVLFRSAAQGSSVAGHDVDIAAQPLGAALQSTLGLTYWGFLDPDGEISQVTLGVLAATAAVVVLVLRRGWPVLTAWLAWVGLIVAFQLAPTSPVSAFIGAFYYQGFFRLETNLYLAVPAMIGVGAALTAAAVAHLFRAWRPAPVATLAAVLGALAVLSMTTLAGYTSRNIDTLASRYSHPNINRYDMSDFAAVDWLHQHIQPGDVIMNSANDGSTLAYVEYGLPLVNTSSMGQPSRVPQTVTLLSRFNTYPQDPEVQRILRDYNVKWVYVDSDAPIILANPRGWTHAEFYTLAPGLANLAGLPGMTVAFRSGHVTVYRLDLDAMPTTSPQPANIRPPG